MGQFIESMLGKAQYGDKRVLSPQEVGEVEYRGFQCMTCGTPHTLPVRAVMQDGEMDAVIPQVNCCRMPQLKLLSNS